MEMLRDAFESRVSVLKIILEVSLDFLSRAFVIKFVFLLLTGAESRIRLHLSHRRYLSHFHYSALLHHCLVLLPKCQAEGGERRE
jgi:hypothetical protein